MFDVNEFDLYADDVEESQLDSMIGASSDEILIACLNKLGRVDIKEMSRCSGKSCEELVLDLRGSAIFQDPAEFTNDKFWSIEKGWLLKPQYCSGNIHRKLNVAKEMNKKFPGCFDCNVDVLKKILPSALCLDEIHVSLGAPWVPADIYADFIKHLLKLKTAPKVLFNKEVHTWQIIPPANEDMKKSVANTISYGTKNASATKDFSSTKDISALSIIEQTMNAKIVKVYDYIPTLSWDYERVFNKNATLVAQEKQRAIISEFDKWARENKRIAACLEEYYNDAFAGYSTSAYDGSFLTFPDLNPDVSFYPHQRNSIARGLLSQDHLLLAQDVGTGKTYVMCACAHERCRMGLSKKIIIVTPNNVLKATVDAYKHLYDDDNYLAVYPKDFVPKKRQQILERIRDGKEGIIFMAYSSLDMVVMSKKYWINEMKTELDTLSNAILNSTVREEKRLLERQKEALGKKLSEYALTAKNPPWLTFDELGIDTLIIDEAHNFKNIPLNTRTENIVGMHTAGSKKCKEMLARTKIVKKLIMATGTPLTYSLADLFVLQTYLQPEEMKFRGVDSFDMWINTFGERETNFEVDVDSKHLRAMTRFSTFHNLTELMALFSTVCDFYHLDENDEALPNFDGCTNVCVKRSEAQTKYIHDLSERTELIRTHKIKRTEDNLLKVTTDGRKCALDIRLVDSKHPFQSEENKIEACAKKIFEIYREFPGTCQIVFSDIGTPKSSFNIYDALKLELMISGIPENEIAYVHDATSETARARLFADINKGKIRIVIGSTAKLGVGVNVQEKLIALHHLSVPWRPADMVQREGRIIRRGNTCDTVYIFRYVTEGSFDSYSWQLLENKQRFISSFLSGTSASRDTDDIADVVLNYAEVKALAIGNPLIKKRVETHNRLERTKIFCRQRQKQLMELRSIIDGTPAELNNLNEQLKVTEKDVALYESSKEVVPQDERIAFGEELLNAVNDNHMQNIERLFDIYQGFSVVLPANMDSERPYVFLRSVNGGSYFVDMNTDKPLGCAKRLDHLLEHLQDKVNSFEEQIINTKNRRDEAVKDIESGNPYEKQVEDLETDLDAIDKLLAQDEEKSA